MSSFSEQTGKRKRIELLRWIGVLPAAVLGRLAVQMILGGLLRLAITAGWITPGTSELLYYFQLLVYYTPKEAAFVIAGAMMAPRRRLPTAVVLAVLAILLSLMVHILGQSNRGLINYTHFAAETLGAIGGAGCMILLVTRILPQPRSGEST